jgi:hypothetical protein
MGYVTRRNPTMVAKNFFYFSQEAEGNYEGRSDMAGRCSE